MTTSLEQAALRHWPGVKIMRMSAALAAAGISPLLLYIVFGPKDGNPIGLGLLAMATVPVAGMGLVAGFIKFCVESLGDRR